MYAPARGGLGGGLRRSRRTIHGLGLSVRLVQKHWQWLLCFRCGPNGGSGHSWAVCVCVCVCVCVVVAVEEGVGEGGGGHGVAWRQPPDTATSALPEGVQDSRAGALCRWLASYWALFVLVVIWFIFGFWGQMLGFLLLNVIFSWISP